MEPTLGNGKICYLEIPTDDVGRSAAFYEAVFGWRRGDFGGMPMFELGDRGIASMADMPPGTPDQVPAFWMAIFAVQDTDATVAQAGELGGQALGPPFDIPDVGRFAVLADPHGVAFGVLTAPPQPA